MRGRNLVMCSDGQCEASKKTAPDRADEQTDKQTHGHGDSKTNSAQRGQIGEHIVCPIIQKVLFKTQTDQN